MDNKNNPNQLYYKYSIIILIIAIIFGSVMIQYYFEKFSDIKKIVNDKEKQIIDLESKLGIENFSLNDIENKTENISKNKYKLHDPTYSEVEQFIYKDKTDEIDIDDYICAQYARDVNNKSENMGIRCGYTIINPDGDIPHSIVAFNTTDEGLVFFEPQNDYEVNLTINSYYWSECVSPLIEKPDDWIVEDFIIIW